MGRKKITKDPSAPTVSNIVSDADNLPSPAPIGRPTDYRPEFCRMLVKHMASGNSFNSFAALVDVGVNTLYLWSNEHPEFMDSKRTGRAKLALFYENLGKMMASGQLRRLAKEEPVLDPQGRPVIDPETGRPMMRREYAPTNGSASAFIFLTKNLIGWKDNIQISGDEDGAPARVAGPSPKQKLEETLQLLEFLKDLDRVAGQTIEIIDNPDRRPA